MAKYNILVVEDESIVSKDIQNSLKKMGYNVVGSAMTGEKAIEIANAEKPDLVLMDIMLKGEMNGIQAAEKIKKDLSIPVIFLTAYADEATLSKAKVTEPHGYIIKPFKEIDLHTSIEMALYKHNKEKEVLKERDLFYSIIEGGQSSGEIFVKANSQLVKVKNEDIVLIEAMKDYIVINTKKEKYTIHSTMKDIEEKLPSTEFQRIHRSFIVSVDKIKAIEQNNVIVDGHDDPIPIGGSYKDQLFKRLNLI